MIKERLTMSEVVTLIGERRTRIGKGGARTCRREDKVPAVVYGAKREPMAIAIVGASLRKELRRPGFLTHVYDIEIDGVRERVLPREVQYDPVSDRPVHLDFLRVAAKTKVHVDVEVAFLNEAAAPGLKKGGVLNVVRHTVEVVCTPEAIPERIEVDLTGLEIGDSVHGDQLVLPAGVALATADREATIATIVPPTTEREPVAEEAAAAAGETPAAS
jgi:large subunit ribosomal protein L25